MSLFLPNGIFCSNKVITFGWLKSIALLRGKQHNILPAFVVCVFDTLDNFLSDPSFLAFSQVVSQPYIDMSLQLLEQFGAPVARQPATDVYLIPNCTLQNPPAFLVEGMLFDAHYITHGNRLFFADPWRPFSVCMINFTHSRVPPPPPPAPPLFPIVFCC